MKNGFLVIHDWMMSDLQLRGTQLQVFSILYSFSKWGIGFWQLAGSCCKDWRHKTDGFLCLESPNI